VVNITFLVDTYVHKCKNKIDEDVSTSVHTTFPRISLYSGVSIILFTLQYIDIPRNLMYTAVQGYPKISLFKLLYKDILENLVYTPIQLYPEV
jgi:hypothetical protein